MSKKDFSECLRQRCLAVIIQGRHHRAQGHRFLRSGCRNPEQFRPPLGDTANHIEAVFQAARDQDAVLFFDEAESLLSKRVATGESCSTNINQNRNTLMQELDRFDGVVLVTTNLFENDDPALLRRIQRHIHFRLPNASMPRELFDLHLPNPERVLADYAVLATLSRGLSD